MNIPQKTVFHPSAVALRLWFSTRKKPLKFSGASIPALFSDSGFGADLACFIGAIIGELVGLSMIVYGGSRLGNTFLWISLAAVIIIFVFDLLFAWKLHRHKGKECEVETELFINEYNAVDKQNKENEGKSSKFVDFLLILGIIALMAIKIWAIIYLPVLRSYQQYAPFILIYLFVAYAHIFHTGYFLAYLATWRKFNSESKDLGLHPARKASEEVILEKELKLPISFHPHEIVLVNSNNNKYTYSIKTTGVLTDSDISNLLADQSGTHIIDVVKACRRIQFEKNIGGAN